MNHCCKSYTRILTLSTVAAVSVMIALNWSVDPFGVYGGNNGGSSQDAETLDGSRVAMAERLRQERHSTILLGTSRVACGLDAASVLFAERTVLKVGLAGADFYETFQAFSFAAEQEGVEEVLLCVDFYQFNANARPAFDFEQSRFNPELASIDYHGEKLLSWRATKNSLRALKSLLTEAQPLRGGQGGGIDVPNSRSRGPRAAFEANARHYLEASSNYGSYRYASERVELFGRLIRIARERGIELHVAILLVHAVQLETIRAAGLWNVFEQWKRDLVRVADLESGTDEIPVWDFTGYGAYTCERIPPEGGLQRMRYYREASHFTVELGEQVLRRMLSDTNEDVGFGVRLTAKSLGAHLQRTRANRAVWLRENPGETAWVRELAQGAGHAPSPRTARQSGVVQR